MNFETTLEIAEEKVFYSPGTCFLFYGGLAAACCVGWQIGAYSGWDKEIGPNNKVIA